MQQPIARIRVSADQLFHHQYTYRIDWYSTDYSLRALTHTPICKHKRELQTDFFFDSGTRASILFLPADDDR